MWSAVQGTRGANLPGFLGAHVANEKTLIADYTRERGYFSKRYLMKYDLAAGAAAPLALVEDLRLAARRANEEKLDGKKMEEPNMAGGFADPPTALKAWTAYLMGPHLITVKPMGKEDAGIGKNAELTVYDAVSQKPLWSKRFPKDAPYVYPASPMVLEWAASEGPAEAEINGDARLRAAIAEMESKRDSIALLQVLDPATGETRGNVLVDRGNGSFTIRAVEVSGDYLLAYDSSGRMLVYSISSGKLLGRTFARNAYISAPAGLLIAESDRGRTTVFTLPAMERRSEMQFPDRLIFGEFSRDGKNFFALTADQTSFVLNAADVAAAKAN